ncbi:MAG: SPOR domain-containing protein [Burkholderiales bacterium]|nr:SPOR domain-containing protein [Burkholderiales bacterium]
MRFLFLALVLANFALFAWSQATREKALRDSYSRLEVMPEKIRVTGTSGRSGPERPQGAPAGARGPSGEPAPAACVEWGIFAGPDIARADAALARVEMPQERLERTPVDGGYWVYLPPMKTRAETDRKVGELKALGVAEFFVVQDAGPWRNAISLGIFRTEDAAQAYLAGLKERGVRSAIAERRENFLKQVAYLVREPDEATVARLALLQKEFPGSELKATACPAAAKG